MKEKYRFQLRPVLNSQPFSKVKAYFRFLFLGVAIEIDVLGAAETLGSVGFKAFVEGGTGITKFEGPCVAAVVVIIGPGTKIVGVPAGCIDIVLPEVRLKYLIKFCTSFIMKYRIL